jgi:hypothetical protein
LGNLRQAVAYVKLGYRSHSHCRYVLKHVSKYDVQLNEN